MAEQPTEGQAEQPAEAQPQIAPEEQAEQPAPEASAACEAPVEVTAQPEAMVTEQEASNVNEPDAGPALDGTTGQANAADAVADAPVASVEPEVIAHTTSDINELTSGLSVFERHPLLEKVKEQLATGDEMKKKWTAFCRVHAVQNIRPEHNDEALLMTFLDAVHDNGIPEYNGNVPWELQEGAGKGMMRPGQGAQQQWGGQQQQQQQWGGQQQQQQWGGQQQQQQWNQQALGQKGRVLESDIGKVFVAGLPKHATETTMHAVFSTFGTVTKVHVKHGEDGLCKGYAFITFEDPNMVNTVVTASAQNGVLFEGKRLDCKECVSKNMPKTGDGKGFGKPPAAGGWGPYDQGKGKGYGNTPPAPAPGKGWDASKGQPCRSQWDQGKSYNGAAQGYPQGKSQWDQGKGGWPATPAPPAVARA